MPYGRISLEQALNSDNFYQLPKVIIGTTYYKKLKAEAKLLFMLCRDRLSASLDSTRKGDLRFVDNEGDVFIYYSIEELAEDLGCGRDKVIKLKKDLIKYGLIDEVRQGLNKANRIYVKNVITDIDTLNTEFEEKRAPKPLPVAEVGKSDFRKSGNSTSRNRKTRLQEVGKSDASYIKESETNNTKIKQSIDTYRYENERISSISDSTAFKMGDHSFLTDKTVELLSHFGSEAKPMENKIFQAKRAVEKEYEDCFKNQIVQTIAGDIWACDLEKEVEKFIFKLKTSEHEGKPIKNMHGYFYKQLEHFWKMALLVEMQAGYIQLFQLSEINRENPAEIPFLIKYFYPEKLSKREVDHYLTDLSKS